MSIAATHLPRAVLEETYAEALVLRDRISRDLDYPLSDVKTMNLVVGFLREILYEKVAEK
jgi:hypothetical protein